MGPCCILAKKVTAAADWKKEQGRIKYYADREGLLYTSIPQDGGWHVRVDGQEVEPVLVGDVMVAVPLTAGSHEVEFVYHNAAFAIGWKISAICLLLFGMTAPIYYSKRRKGRFEK